MGNWILRLGILAAMCGAPAFAADAALDTSLASEVIAQNVSVKGDALTGRVVNRSTHTLREVRLQITYAWMWNDERHPGANAPGRTDYYTLAVEIPSGGSAPFTYRPSPPLETRSDGHFVPSVSVVGATEVVPAGE